MTKKAIVFIFVLLLFSGCFVFLQWNHFSTAKDRGKLEYDVSIRHVNGRFLVEQTIQHIPEGIHEVNIPNNIQQLACQNSVHQSCIWLNREKSKMAADAKEKITFTYSIPAPKNRKHFILKDWLVYVAADGDFSTRIQLSEEIWRSGEWLASAELVGMKKQKTLDYYVFQEENALPVLYWNSDSLQEVYSDQNITIHSKRNLQADISKLRKIKRNKKLLVILTNMDDKVKDYGNVLIIPDTFHKSGEKLFLPIIKNSLAFQKKDEWMADLIASALLERPVGNEKSKKMYAEMKNTLRGETIDQWLTLIFSTGKAISGETLNHYLEQAAQAKTDFFRQNGSNDEASVSPLYMIEKRDIFINGKRTGNVTIVYHGGRSYISFIPLAEALGYSVQSKKNQAVIAKGNETAQFYYDKKIFIKNGRKFGFAANPFLLMGKERYVNAGFVNPMFGVEIHEKKNEIQVE